MNNLNLIKTDGQFYADSRDVAEAIEREHGKLLRTIREYCEYLGEAKIGLSDFFVEATYTNAQNKEMPCYLITRKGCDMIANKLTGKKGVLFTAAYVTAFEKMREQLTMEHELQTFSSKSTSVGEVATMIKTLRNVMKDQKSSPIKIAVMAKGLCQQFGIAIPNDFVETSQWEQMEMETAI